VSNGGNHTPAFTSAAATPEAHQACLEVCKALALTGLRVIEDDQFYLDVRSRDRQSNHYLYIIMLQVRTTFEDDMANTRVA
jgi:hypothetical protein